MLIGDFSRDEELALACGMPFRIDYRVSEEVRQLLPARSRDAAIRELVRAEFHAEMDGQKQTTCPKLSGAVQWAAIVI